MKRRPDSERLQNLLDKRAKIRAQIDALEAREGARQRREANRLKIIVGAAMLADAALHPDVLPVIRRVLDRAVVSPRDRAFVIERGLIQPAKETTTA